MRSKPNELPIAEKAAITQIQTSRNYSYCDRVRGTRGASSQDKIL